MWVGFYITAPQGLTCWDTGMQGHIWLCSRTPWLMLFTCKPLTMDFPLWPFVCYLSVPWASHMLREREGNNLHGPLNY